MNEIGMSGVYFKERKGGAIGQEKERVPINRQRQHAISEGHEDVAGRVSKVPPRGSSGEHI